ncbi:NUDIX hydrolase [Candidatus Gottesmanbacteria bacterium]|nr:NUDIX hydrolase [Candidatus Gottesmanbacteria bacterium]
MTAPFATCQYRYCPSCQNKLEKKLLDERQRLVCSPCGFIFWNNPKPSVSAILANENKILLLKRSHAPFKNYWVLPGGYIEYDEDPKSSIIREVKEETGFDIIINTIIAAYLIDTDPKGNSIDIVYAGNITGGNLSLREHGDGKFFAVDCLPDPIAYKHKEVIIYWNTKND